MAEASRSQITITLGGSGQVVKRAGNGMDGFFIDKHPVVGSKRPVRDRLGSNVESSGGFNNKRFRGDARTSSSSAHDEIRLSKDDLRHKIKKKHIQRQSRNGQNGGDLRNILSRPAKRPANISVSRQRMPEPKDAGPSYRKIPDPEEQYSTDTRDRGQYVLQARNFDQHREEYRSQNVTRSREQRPDGSAAGIVRVPELENGRHNFPGPNSSDVMGNVSGPRAASTRDKVDPGFDSYSPWNLQQIRRRSPDETLPTTRTLQQLRRRSPDEALPTARTQQQLRRRSPDEALPTARTQQQLRRRSPDEALPTSRTLQQLRQRSPDEALPITRGLATGPRSDEELQRRYSVSTYDDAKAMSMRKDAFDYSRPMTSSSGLTKTAPPVGSGRTLAAPPILAPQLPQPNTLTQRSTYVQLDDNVTVDSLLKLLCLERYSILFKAEEVDMYSLKRMSEADLKEMGVPMGPRKKILLALQPRLRRQA